MKRLGYLLAAFYSVLAPLALVLALRGGATDAPSAIAWAGSPVAQLALAAFSVWAAVRLWRDPLYLVHLWRRMRSAPAR